MFPDNWAKAWLQMAMLRACCIGFGVAGLVALAPVVSGVLGAAQSQTLAQNVGVVGTAWQAAHASRVRLIGGGLFDADVSKIPTRAAAIELTLDPQWKTYWRMPGVSGVPPQFDFSKSSNLASAEVFYPAPQRFTDKSGDAIGYKSRVVFPIRVVPHDASKPVTLTVDLAFGVCKDICVPLETQFALELPPSNVATAPIIQAAREQVPRSVNALRPGDPQIQAIVGSIVGGARQIEISVKMSQDAAASVDLFVEGPEGLFVPMARKLAARGESALFVVDFSKLADAKDLLGKALRFTAVTSSGASDLTWTAR